LLSKRNRASVSMRFYEEQEGIVVPHKRLRLFITFLLCLREFFLQSGYRLSDKRVSPDVEAVIPRLVYGGKSRFYERAIKVLISSPPISDNATK
jgi:hypothetical protein